MFEFLKNKLKQVVSKFTKKIEEEAKPIEVEAPLREKPAKELPEKQPPEPRPEKPKAEPIKAEKKEPQKPKSAEKEGILEPPQEIPKPLETLIPQPEKKEEPKERTQESAQEIKEPPKEEKRSFFGIFRKKDKEEPEHKPKPKEEPKEEKKSLFETLKEKVTRQTINENQFEEMFSDLEMALLENNVALEVIDKIKLDLKAELVDKPLERGKVNSIIESSLKKTIEELFEVEGIDLLKRIKQKKPFIICFVGINGSGKTTTIAKLAYLLKKHNLSSVIAASDTFRAAAIQQLEVHANKLGIKLIKHDYGSDSAAVAYDAISHAKAHNIDVVLIDTAGRLHSNTNLMDEVKKVKRVTSPDLVIFVGESITGNDCVEQAKVFDEQLGIDGIILAKSDVDEKGGAAISISYITKKPIMYLGTGQGYEDLIEFDPKIIVKSLGLET